MQSVVVAKDKHLHVRVGPEDQERLAALARHYELPEAAVVRMLIKRDAEAIVKAASVEAPPLPSPSRPRAKPSSSKPKR